MSRYGHSLLLAALIAVPVYGAWMPEWSQGLTSSLPRRALLTNLLAAVQERTIPTYYGTDTNGVEAFDVGPLAFTNTYTTYDYSNRVVCGITTQIIAGVTNIFTNWCPSTAIVTSVNEVAFLPDRDLLQAIDTKLLDLIPHYVDHRLADTNGVYDTWFLTNKVQRLPHWSLATLLEYTGGGTVTTNTFGGATWTNGYWLRQPPRTNRIMLAGALAVPQTYYVGSLGESNVLDGEYMFEATNRWWRGTTGGYLVPDGPGTDLFDWYLSVDTAPDFFSDYLSPADGSFIPRPGVWSGFFDTNTFLVSWSNESVRALSMAYMAAVSNPHQKINPLAWYSNIMPVIEVTRVDTATPPDVVTVALHGDRYFWKTNSPIAGVTNAAETIIVSGLVTQASVKWVNVTSLYVIGTASNIAGLAVCYTNLNDTFDYDLDHYDWLWFREALLARYHIVNNLRHTAPDSNQVWYIHNEGYRHAGTSCAGNCDTNITGYTGYLSGGMSQTNALLDSESYGHRLDASYGFGGIFSETAFVTGKVYCSETFKIAEFADDAIPVFYVSTSAPSASAEYYATTNLFIDSDGREDNSTGFPFYVTGSISGSAGASYLTNGHAASFVFPDLLPSAGEARLEAYLDGLSNLAAGSWDDSGYLYAMISGCNTNEDFYFASGDGVSVREERYLYGAVFRWQFEHLDL